MSLVGEDGKCGKSTVLSVTTALWESWRTRRFRKNIVGRRRSQKAAGSAIPKSVPYGRWASGHR